MLEVDIADLTIILFQVITLVSLVEVDLCQVVDLIVQFVALYRDAIHVLVLYKSLKHFCNIYF